MNKRVLIVVGVVVLVLLLGGAAFVAGQLVNGQGLPVLASGGGQKFFVGQGGKPAQGVQMNIIPAKELPQTPAEVKGIFDHRQDNSFFVGTGQVTMRVMKDQSGNVNTGVNHDGPTLEVVVTTQTTVYRDVTLKQFADKPTSGQVQQVVEPGTLDEVGQSSTVTAWGKKTGDRVIADVFVYTPPPVLMK